MIIYTSYVTLVGSDTPYFIMRYTCRSQLQARVKQIFPIYIYIHTATLFYTHLLLLAKIIIKILN
jgi:hypothetical protein